MRVKERQVRGKSEQKTKGRGGKKDREKIEVINVRATQGNLELMLGDCSKRRGKKETRHIVDSLKF